MTAAQVVVGDCAPVDAWASLDDSGGLVAAKDLPDLEQRHIRDAPIGIALRGGDQPGNQARPHVGQISRDRIGQPQGVRGSAEPFGVLARHEAERHALHQAARRQRPTGNRGSLLAGR